MKTIAAMLFAMVILGPPVQAQTIVGESTYEDNFLHKPPSPSPERVPARTGNGAASAVSHDGTRAPSGPASPDGRR